MLLTLIMLMTAPAVATMKCRKLRRAKVRQIMQSG